MPNIAMTPSESLSPAEVKKRLATSMIPFTVSREKFSNWFRENVAPDIDWTNPMVGHMFQSWVAGSGITEWLTDEEVAARERRRQKALETKARFDQLRAEKEKKEGK